MRIALAQMDSGQDGDANLDWIRVHAELAASRGAELLLLPEACLYRGKFRPELAESADGPALTALRGTAVATGIAVLVGGMWLRSDDPGKPFNAAVFVDDSGAILGCYRKVHLFRINLPTVTEDEAVCTTPGAELVTVAWRSLVFGLSICYDLRFPELYRALARAGGDVLCVPANFSAHTGPAHWAALLRARAIENVCYMAAPAQTGLAPDGFASYGHSMVVGPWGTIEAAAGAQPGLVIGEIDPVRLAECRSGLSPVTQARPAVYRNVRRQGAGSPPGHARPAAKRPVTG